MGSSRKSAEPTPDAAPLARRGPAPGQFCDEHFSWLCQAGQGKCQRGDQDSGGGS